jgi:hypothetical protein
MFILLSVMDIKRKPLEKIKKRGCFLPVIFRPQKNLFMSITLFLKRKFNEGDFSIQKCFLKKVNWEI